MPEIPQSDIAATIFFGGRETGREIGQNFGQNLLAVQNYAKTFSPNSPQFITPCPANEMSKLDLRELLGLEGANFRRATSFAS